MDVKVFYVLADWQIRDLATYCERIWGPAKALNIARVPWLDALTRIYAYDGRIYWPSHRPFAVPEIDQIFTDPENRWMTDFLEANTRGDGPRRHCRIVPKLRLIALYCDIARAERGGPDHPIRLPVPGHPPEGPTTAT